MDRWGAFGWLDKAAAISFVGGMPGAALAVLISQILGKDWLGWLLFFWFLPTFLWLFCFWSVHSRYHFGGVVGILGAGCLLAALRAPLEEMLLAFLVSIAASGVAAVFAPVAVRLVNAGRSPWAKHEFT